MNLRGLRSRGLRRFFVAVGDEVAGDECAETTLAAAFITFRDLL